MNKFIKLLLSSLILLSLSACGEKEHEHQALLDMLESNNYEEAINYVNDLAYEYAKENEQTIQKDSLETQLIGEWDYVESSHYEFTKFKTMNFKDNYTVDLDEKEYLWKVINQYDDSIEVLVLDGATEYIKFTFKRDAYKINLGEYERENSYQWNNVNFFHISDYDKIEINIDNWQDYIEIIEVPEWHNNSFDETTSLTIARKFKIKDEYFEKMPNLFNHLAYQIEYKTSHRLITVDWDNKTYQLGDITKQYDNVNNSTSKLSYGNYNDKKMYVSTFNSMHYSKESSNDYVSNYTNEINMVRIEGEIYIKK